MGLFQRNIVGAELAAPELQTLRQWPLRNDFVKNGDADDFLQANVDRFAIRLNPVDSRFADIDFASRRGVSQIVHIGAFQHQRFFANLVQPPNVDEWRFDIYDNILANELFHRQIPQGQRLRNRVPDFK